MSDTLPTIKRKIIALLLAEKQASYDNMMRMQNSEMKGAEKESEADGGMLNDGKKDQAMNRIEARASTVDALQRDINLLNGLGSIEANEEIQLGDVIKTDKGNFFVAVPADEFEVEGVAYRGISTDSPLFKELRGKKDGDTVKVNDNSFKLISSF